MFQRALVNSLKTAIRSDKRSGFVSSSNIVLNRLINRKMSSEQEKAQTAKPTADTIFGKITRKEIPTKFLHEDDLCVAFEDINPVAPVHFLVVPKKPIQQLSKSEDADQEILGRLLCVARKVAAEKGIASNGYRIVINDGVQGCQSVYHLHVHVIGGKQLGWPPVGPMPGVVGTIHLARLYANAVFSRVRRMLNL